MDNFISLDLEKCTGCRVCELACSLHNEKQCNPEKSRIRIRTLDVQRCQNVPDVADMVCGISLGEVGCRQAKR